MAEETATPKKNVYISLHESFIHEGIKYTDKKTGEEKTFNVVRLPKDTIIDGKDVLVVIVEGGTREHNSHWEAGAKQNFDTGLYKAHTILYIRTEDYGPKPKVGKPLVMDAGTDHKRTFDIMKCEEECGVFRMMLQRTRQ